MSKKTFPSLVLAASLLVGSAYAGDEDPSQYVGAFSASDEQFITITLGDDGLEIEGNATWGMGDPERVERGGVNMGEFSASVPRDWISNKGFSFAVAEEGTVPASEAEQYDCVIKIKFGPDASYFDAKDNYSCGGMNVTFSGRYFRRAAE